MNQLHGPVCRIARSAIPALLRQHVRPTADVDQQVLVCLLVLSTIAAVLLTWTLLTPDWHGSDFRALAQGMVI
jgi:hypothetical protein